MFKRLRVSSTALGELFESSATFQVPAFQRPFDWGAEHALQLLDDVSRAAGIDAPELSEPDYFLGTVLLLADDAVHLNGGVDDARSVDVVFDVIDGQQRLTTLTVIFCALRDLGVGNQEVAARLERLISRPVNADEFVTRPDQRFRLELAGVDKNVLKSCVQGRGSLQGFDEHSDECDAACSKVVEVSGAIVAALSELEPEQRRSLATYLMDNCHVVVTLSDDIDRAHRLFTVLNERGKPLRRNDILKVEVLGGLHGDVASYANAMWQATEQLLGPGFEKFFSHLKSVHGRKSTSVVTGLRSLIAEVGGARSFIKEILLPYAKIFARIEACRDAPVPHNDELSQRLHYLGRLRGDDWVPAVMMALHKYEVSPQTAIALVRRIDRLAHLTRILCQGGGRRTTRFNRVIRAIKSGEAMDESAEVFTLNREELRNAKFNLRNLHRRNQPVCKLLLLRINDYIDGTVSVVDPTVLSVEHVLPMRPAGASDWRILFADPELRTAATDSLGNLTLLPDKLNDRIRNHDFLSKRDAIREYFSSDSVLAIVRDVMGATEWDLETVAARERKLLAAMSDILDVDLRDAAMDIASGGGEDESQSRAGGSRAGQDPTVPGMPTPT